MKKTLLIAAIALATQTAVQAQNKLYDFSFNNTLTANVGVGTFSNSGIAWSTDRHGNANGAVWVQQTLNPSLRISANLPNLPTGNAERTISIWFKRKGGANGGLFAYGESANLKIFGAYFIGGQLNFQGFGTGNDRSFPDVGETHSNWMHFALTYDGNIVKAFYNGNIIDSFARVLNTGTTNPFSLGNIEAEFDDLKVYDKALSATQIKQLFNNNEIGGTTSIPLNQKVENIAIYPNPAQHNLTIELEQTQFISIADIAGNEVLSTQMGSGINQINIDFFTAGVYILTTQNGHKMKFIKN